MSIEPSKAWLQKGESLFAREEGIGSKGFVLGKVSF